MFLEEWAEECPRRAQCPQAMMDGDVRLSRALSVCLFFSEFCIAIVAYTTTHFKETNHMELMTMAQPASRSALPADPALRRFGGPNCNQGRKRKSEKYATEIEKAERRICDRLPEIVDAMIRAAVGQYTESVDPDTGKKVRVYTVEPDMKAAEYLVNRVLGRPKQQVEVENKGETRHTVNLFLPHNGREDYPLTAEIVLPSSTDAVAAIAGGDDDD